MRSLLVVALLVTHAAADRATVVIDHAQRPFKHGNQKPVTVLIDGKASTVAVAKTLKVELAVGAAGKVVTIEVRIPGVDPIRRHAALVPGVTYTVRGNPCSFWELAVPRDDPDKPTPDDTYRVDASKLASKLFPLTVNGDTLAKPGVTKPFTGETSAMCLRSGASIEVKSGAKVLFDEMVIGHPGRQHTITLRPGGFTIAVDP